MKCEQCGGELRLEDACCPQCGSANPWYEKHRGDMEQYGREYADTKQKVLTKNKGFTKKMAWLAVIVVLVCVELVLLVIGSQAETICRNYLEQYTVNHLDEYAALCEEYIQKGDYDAFEALYRIKRLDDYEYDYDELYGYRNFSYIISYYAPSMQSLVYMAIDAPDSDNADREKRIKTIARELHFMHEWMEENYGKDDERYVQMLEDIEAQTEAMMLAYGGLEPDKALHYFELSYDEQLKLLKEGLLNDEE